MPETPPLWTSAEIESAVGGRLSGDPFEVSGITYNSREIVAGDLFLALKGARDGHEFASAAFAAGAAGAITERPVAGGPSVVVADTLRALEALGVASRERSPQVRRGAVTGSVGKTSVTQAIKAGLDLAGPAHASIMAGLSVMAVGERGRDLSLVARRPTPEGQRLTLDVRGTLHEVLLPLAGAFQASNALVAAGLCIAGGEAPEAVLAGLERITGAQGRLQRIPGPGRGEVYVDYAHTPDGLETVLSALRPHATGRLIVVFGAGGDRDRAKRPMMGEIAGRLADVAIVTDDNPRSEDPAAIRRAVREGCPDAQEIGDRRAAIRHAIEQMRDGDVVVIAGKGHEQGQIVGGVTYPFDDATEAALAQLIHA